MSLRRRIQLVLAAACLAAVGMLHAQQVADPAAFVAKQTELRARVLAGRGAFKAQSPLQREALAASQARLIALLGGRRSFDDLAPAERDQALALMTSIRDAIARAEDERRVCEQVRRIGSNRPEVVCTTAAQMRKRRGGPTLVPLDPRASTCEAGACMSELTGQLMQVEIDKADPVGMGQAIGTSI